MLAVKKLTAGTATVDKPLNSQQFASVRDTVAKAVYVCVFDWIVAFINNQTVPENKDSPFIGAQALHIIGAPTLFSRYSHAILTIFSRYSARKARATFPTLALAPSTWFSLVL
jgi:hypothetical protein